MEPFLPSANLSGRMHVFGRPQASRNCVLRRLSVDESTRIAPHVKTVRLEADAVLFDEEDPAGHAYFPLDSVISLQRTTRDGATVEFGMVGSEGALGVETLLESERAPGRAVAVRAGYAIRIPGHALLAAFRRYSPFRSGLLSSCGAFNSQVVQRSICHRAHTIEQQFCTWLLLMHDRAESGRLDVTHEAIGGLLGGRREGVSLIVRRLRSDRLISAGYRSLHVLDRAGLEARGCECYGAIRGAYSCLKCNDHQPFEIVNPRKRRDSLPFVRRLMSDEIEEA